MCSAGSSEMRTTVTKRTFNKETGTSTSTRSHFADVKPLGYFYRQKGRPDTLLSDLEVLLPQRILTEPLKECGFEILICRAHPSVKRVLLRAKTMAWNKSALRQEILSKYGGYPASI